MACIMAHGSHINGSDSCHGWVLFLLVQSIHTVEGRKEGSHGTVGIHSTRMDGGFRKLNNLLLLRRTCVLMQRTRKS